MKQKSNCKKVNSENELLLLLVDFLKNRGYKIRVEVPNMGQSADIVATRGRWVTCIEAKINNWERAIEQCKAHETVGDFIYIAIASVTPPENLLSKANRLGYGIIHCNPYSGKCSIVLKAKNNSKIWMPQREIFVEKMKEINYAY